MILFRFCGSLFPRVHRFANRALHAILKTYQYLTRLYATTDKSLGTVRIETLLVRDTDVNLVLEYSIILEGPRNSDCVCC
jgi:hypothetical protein